MSGRDPAEFWSSAAGGRPKRPLQDVGNRGASGVIVPRKQRKASSGATGKGGREVAHFIAKQAKKWAQIDDDVDLFEMCVPVSCLLSAPEALTMPGGLQGHAECARSLRS